MPFTIGTDEHFARSMGIPTGQSATTTGRSATLPRNTIFVPRPSRRLTRERRPRADDREYPLRRFMFRSARLRCNRQAGFTGRLPTLGDGTTAAPPVSTGRARDQQAGFTGAESVAPDLSPQTLNS